MLSRLVHRSHRRLLAALAVAALMVALTSPLQAAPRDEGSEFGPSVVIESWLQHLVELVQPVLSAWEPSLTEGQVSDLNGQCMDPNGQPIPCPDSD